jgi:hypothetical protein
MHILRRKRRYKSTFTEKKLVTFDIESIKNVLNKK